MGSQAYTIKRGVSVDQRSSPRKYCLPQSHQDLTDITAEMNQLQLCTVSVCLLYVTPLNICYLHLYSETLILTVMILTSGAFGGD